jgi:hypothetical protein
MKIGDLQDRIADRYENFDDMTEHRSVPEVIRDIVRDVVDGLGFHVNDAGDICDPRPAPPAIPHQTNVRFRGPRKRR